ncbi:heterokaryon incompatibility protein-domain-containing protein [Hypoxylon sp. FL1284]|nr:heterokaryon incompatibility protein-domain-containing protein [Hypoxylon sp. FL1284]
MPEDLQPNLPESLVNELTESIMEQSLQEMVNESHEVMPDEILQHLLDEFNETLPDDVARPPNDVALRGLRYTLLKQQIDQNPDLVGECRGILLDQYRQRQHDDYRQFIQSGRQRTLADGFPQAMLRMWRRLHTEIRDRFSTLKPEFEEMCIIAEQVQAILQGLCEKDRRFSFIRSAILELFDGDVGINAARERLDRIIFTDPNQLEDDIAMNKLSDLLAGPTSSRQRDPADKMSSKEALQEIVDSTIYELLEIFCMDITPEQLSIDPTSVAHFELLCDLYSRSELSTPRPALQVLSESPEDNKDSDGYQYQTRLNSAMGDIRVLQVLPNANKGDIVECHLVSRNLYHDGIPEALSYVWGKPTATDTEFTIHIDHQRFTVTPNLHGILKELRRTDTIRELWIDAICINQKDSQEKTQQVRLMKDIYSRAKRTVVWLSGRRTATEQPAGPAEEPENSREHLKSFNMGEWYVPLSTKFGGVDVDQYDLATILRKAQKYYIDDTWNERQWVLYTMLIRCAALVMMHSWWERVWTIQEGACPPNPPIFYFRGHTFSFDDFTAAMNILTRISSTDDAHVSRQLENIHDVLGYREVWDNIYRIGGSETGLLSHGPLLLQYRRRMEGERYSAVKSFSVLLAMAETYRSTDPRDKIFALQSLLPKCMGLLINVDYYERCEVVFRRVTARYYNHDQAFRLIPAIKYWFESPLAAKEPVGPSWVLDFTYNDASYCGEEEKDRVTLDGFIYKNKLPLPNFEYDGGHTHLCTPRILFCTGRLLDQIHWITHIPRFSDDESFTGFQWAVWLSLQILNARESIFGLPIANNFDYGVNHELYHELIALKNFLLMQDREPQGLEDRNRLAKSRNEELAGKQVFITGHGLVGIATAPVESDDILSWIHGSPIFLVLREVRVGDQDSGSDGSARQHRIVARAAVNDKLVHEVADMKTLIDLTPSRSLQIV